jgi:hypothetical protein
MRILSLALAVVAALGSANPALAQSNSPANSPVNTLANPPGPVDSPLANPPPPPAALRSPGIIFNPTDQTRGPPLPPERHFAPGPPSRAPPMERIAPIAPLAPRIQD